MITQTYTPKTIVYAGHTPIAVPITVAPGLDLEAGTLMGRVTASGLYVAYDAAGTDDGRRSAVGILAEPVNTSSTGMNEATVASMYVAFGLLQTDKLVGADTDGLAGMNARSIVGHNITMLGGGNAYSFPGDLTVDSLTTTANGTIAGNLAVSGNAAVTGTLTQTGNAAFAGNVAVTGILTQTGAATLAGLLTADGGIKITETTGSDTAMAIAATYNLVRCTTFTVARTYSLPAAATYGVNRILIVVAPSNANTYNLTLDGDAAETINGAATKVVSTAYGALILLAVTGGWVILSAS